MQNTLFPLDVYQPKETCIKCVYRISVPLNEFSPKVIQCCEKQISRKSNSGYKTIKVTDKACKMFKLK